MTPTYRVVVCTHGPHMWVHKYKFTDSKILLIPMTSTYLSWIWPTTPVSNDICPLAWTCLKFINFYHSLGVSDAFNQQNRYKVNTNILGCLLSSDWFKVAARHSHFGFSDFTNKHVGSLPLSAQFNVTTWLSFLSFPDFTKAYKLTNLQLLHTSYIVLSIMPVHLEWGISILFHLNYIMQKYSNHGEYSRPPWLQLVEKQVNSLIIQQNHITG